MSGWRKSPDQSANAEGAKHPFQDSADTHKVVRPFHTASASNGSSLKSVAMVSSLLLAEESLLAPPPPLPPSCPSVLLWHGNSSVVSFQILADLMS